MKLYTCIRCDKFQLCITFKKNNCGLNRIEVSFTLTCKCPKISILRKTAATLLPDPQVSLTAHDSSWSPAIRSPFHAGRQTQKKRVSPCSSRAFLGGSIRCVCRLLCPANNQRMPYGGRGESMPQPGKPEHQHWYTAALHTKNLHFLKPAIRNNVGKPGGLYAK